MKILLINQYFYPEIASTAQLMTELCEDLVKYGHEVTVVAGFPGYEKKRKGLYEVEYYKGIKIIRTYVYHADRKAGFIKRLLNYISFTKSSFIGGLFSGKQDIMFVLSQPPLMGGISAYVISRLKRIGYIYNVQDLYPDIAVDLGVLKNKVLIKFLENVEKFIYKKAKKIAVIGPTLHHHLIKKGVPESKIAEIPNWIDTGNIKPDKKDNAFSREYNLHNEFVVMYSGNIGYSQPLEMIIETAKELTEIQFVIIGGGAKKDKLINMTKGVNNILFLPYQPKEKLSEVFASADIQLILLKKGIANYSVPSKVYGIMASGKPIIASIDEFSEIKSIIDQGCGICVPPEDTKALIGAIKKLYKDSRLCRKYGENGRELVEKEYSRKIITKKYEKMFSD